GGGGLSDVLGGLLGGGGGARGAGLGGLLGGLGGLLGGMRNQGLGRQVDSWVAPGPNEPVAPQELERHFDPQELDEIARRAGTDRAGLLAALSEVMPRLVDRMTPQGRVPEREEDLGGRRLEEVVRSTIEESDAARSGSRA
ncbi:MAG TPA: YidB family protein, partial [Acetobacteraceae bacterium]|nr:YidB family protein [Acetobacteraceae bacterium]